MDKKVLFIIDEVELKYFEFNDLVTNFWLIKEFLKRDLYKELNKFTMTNCFFMRLSHKSCN